MDFENRGCFYPGILKMIEYKTSVLKRKSLKIGEAS